MFPNPYDSYLESRVLAASPLELVLIAYQAAIDEVDSARRCLAVNDIAGRARHASKASALISELAQSLDEAQGGALARQLRELYAYLLTRIQDGNFHQSDAPFAEAARLLRTLLEAWQSIQPEPGPVSMAAGTSNLELSI